MALAKYRTPNIEERQILIVFWDDADGFYWHHRVLLLLTSQPGVWLGSTPYWEVQRIDLNQHQVVPLVRDAPLPAGYAATCYVFDSPIVAADLARAKTAAAALMDVLGLQLAAQAAAAGPAADAVT